ncbi:MAG TPA: DHA2 family efflux MFS transporter permease subunit [Candidatus Saccharimonadales bacterium]|nr:DHA2 family efflux MFS transporter permease subunit [Candidatus Saccharimonadales bacterium]
MAKAKRELSKHSENKWAILALLVLAQFMVVLDVAIVNVALPSIARELHFSGNNLQWVITAYTLTFGGFLLLGGRAADLYGRRKIFIASVSFFALMSLLCGLAASETQIIIARAFQGLAAAFMSPAALSIVLSEFEEGKERNKAMGIWAAVSAGGAAAGVLLGGVLTQYLSWRWNFFVNVPVGIAVVFVSIRMLPHHIGEEHKKATLDLPGAVLATSGLMSIVYGLSKAPADGWGSTTVWAFIAGGVALLLAFVWNERRTDQPLMPLEIFKIRNLAGANTAFLVIACTLFSMFFFLTLYVQTVLHYSPVKTGLCFLPVTFIVAIMSGIVSNLVGKIGYKPPMNLGPVVIALGLFILSKTMKVDGNYWHNVFPGLATFACGMGLTFVSGTLAATSGVPKHFSGLASGILNTSQQVGGAIGLGILSAVAFSTVKAEVSAGGPPLAAQVHGYVAGIQVGVGLAIAAALVVLLVVKNHKVDAKEAMMAG